MSASGGDVGQSSNDSDEEDSLVYIIVLTIVGIVLILLVVVIVWVVRRNRQKRGGTGATTSTASSDMYTTNDNEVNNRSEYGIMKLAPVSPSAPPPMYDSVPRKSRENGSGGSGSDAGSQKGDLYVTLPSTVEVDKV